MISASYPGYNAYRGGNAWFICDRCSQRWRRSEMHTEWTGLKVDIACLDPRPPQMQPPNIYPEGIPFFDARPPQDRPDRLQDDTSLQSVTGGVKAPYGQLYPNGQNQQPGSLSPLQVEQSPVVLSPNVLEDDITIITGYVAAPGVTLGDSAPTNTILPSISGDTSLGSTLTGDLGQWTGNP